MKSGGVGIVVAVTVAGGWNSRVTVKSETGMMELCLGCKGWLEIWQRSDPPGHNTPSPSLLSEALTPFGRVSARRNEPPF